MGRNTRKRRTPMATKAIAASAALALGGGGLIWANFYASAHESNDSAWNQTKAADAQKHIDAGRLFIGCEGSEPLIGKAVELVGHRPFMFSSDFPHEVNNVFCKEEIEELEENDELSDADKAAILGENARLFYQLAAVPAAVLPHPSPTALR